MVDGMDTYNSVKINIGIVMKNPEMLKLMPDHLKTKQMCNYAVKKLPYLLGYVPNQCKTKTICNGAILENGGTLEPVPNR